MSVQPSIGNIDIPFCPAEQRDQECFITFEISYLFITGLAESDPLGAQFRELPGEDTAAE